MDRLLAYFNSKKFSRAREDYTRVLRLDPNYAPTYYNRAKASLPQQELEKAKASLTDAVNKGIDITDRFWERLSKRSGF